MTVAKAERRKTTAAIASPGPTQAHELREMLSARRREIVGDVRSRLRDGRAERSLDASDSIDQSDAHMQEDLDLALLQMRAETLRRVDEALVRLDAGRYGACFECGGSIAISRLRALPFAVRCRACEQTRESGDRREDRGAGWSVGASLFSDAVIT